MKPRKRELIHNFFRAFIPAVTNAHQYTVSHQQTRASLEVAYRHLLEAMEGDDIFSFLIIDDRIIMHGEPLDDGLYISRLIRLFRSRGIEHLQIRQGLPQEELTAFMEMLTASRTASAGNASFPHILVGSVVLSSNSGGLKQRRENNKPLFEKILAADIDLMVEIYCAVKKNHQLPGDDVFKIVADIIAAVRQESSMLLAFSALRVLDEYSFTHSVNVCILTLSQAMALGVEDSLLHDIGVAALLHDIGKIFVPEEVLNKRGKLTDAEWEMIRQHPQQGAEYLMDNPAISALAVTVAYEHHMCFDFSGYPRASKSWRQNMCSQMTTLSDFFDAMRTKRIYRDSVETNIIADQMKSMAGTTLHPVLTKNFLILLGNMLEEQEKETCRSC